MSEASVLNPDPQAGAASPMPAGLASPPGGHPPALLLSRILLALLAFASILALVLVLILWQRVGGMREQLARQSADAIAQAMEARTLARQAQDVVRDTAGRLALAETRVAEVSLQRAQLEELMQNLSRSRDENLVVDIESAVRLALQQAQVTGDVQPLLAALKAGDLRIARASQPRLAPLQRAMQRDADRLRTSANVDNSEALQKIDDLMRLMDDLPAANAVALRAGGVDLQLGAPLAADAPWWQRFLTLVRSEARNLLRVGRVDRPEAVLLSPDQVFFLRENIKLKLLNARLTLLSRQVDTTRAELASIGTSLNKYFDPSSRRVQSAATLLQQLQGQVRTSETPRIEDTLAALATAAAGR